MLPVKYRLYMASEIGFTNERSAGHIDTNIHNIPLTSYTENSEVYSESTQQNSEQQYKYWVFPCRQQRWSMRKFYKDFKYAVVMLPGCTTLLVCVIFCAIAITKSHQQTLMVPERSSSNKFSQAGVFNYYLDIKNKETVQNRTKHVQLK